MVSANVNTTSETHIRALAAELNSRSRQLILTGGLGFTIPPTITAPVPELPTMDPNDLQLHRLSLRSDEPANIPVLDYERWLLVARKELSPHTACDDAFAGDLSANLEEAFRNLQLHKVEEWERQQEDVHLREGLKALFDSLTPEACTSFGAGTHTNLSVGHRSSSLKPVFSEGFSVSSTLWHSHITFSWRQSV